MVARERGRGIDVKQCWSVERRIDFTHNGPTCEQSIEILFGDVVLDGSMPGRARPTRSDSSGPSMSARSGNR